MKEGNKKKEESEVEGKGSLLPQEAVKEFKRLKETIGENTIVP